MIEAHLESSDHFDSHNPSSVPGNKTKINQSVQNSWSSFCLFPSFHSTGKVLNMLKKLCFFLLVLSQYKIFATPVSSRGTPPPPEVPQVPYVTGGEFENKAELHSVKFHSVGKYAATTHYLHIRLPLYIKPIFEAMDNFSLKIQPAQKKQKRFAASINFYKKRFQEEQEKEDWPPKKKTSPPTKAAKPESYPMLQKQALAAMSGTRQALEDLVTALPENPVSPNRHKKRFLDIILALVGVAFSTYNGVQIQKLDARMANNAQGITLLKDITHLHENHLKLLDDKVKLHDELFLMMKLNHPSLHHSIYKAANLAMEQQVDAVRAAISGALQHRLAPGVYHEEALESVLAYIKQVCREHNFHNLIHHTSDLYQLETSFLYNPENMTFSTILHIPLVQLENLLDMYQYIPLPLNTHFSSEHSLIPSIDHRNIIAVGKGNMYKELAPTDLLSCMKMGAYHFCHGNTILQTDTRSSCLSSIYAADREGCRENCQFAIASKREAVYPLENNQFKIYTAQSIVVQEDCKDLKRSFQVTNDATVRIGQGCKARTQDHLLLGQVEDTVQLDEEDNTRAWAWNLTHLFPGVSHDNFEEALKNLKAKGFQNVDATDLLHQLDIVSATPAWTFFSWAYLLPVGVFCILMMCVGWALFKKCCS